MRATMSECPRSVSNSPLRSRSHNCAVVSLPLTANTRPSGLNTASLTRDGIVRISRPVAASQTRAVAADPPVQNRVPSGLKNTRPISVRAAALDRSQANAVLSVLPQPHLAQRADRHPAFAQRVNEQRYARLRRGPDDSDLLQARRIIESRFRTGLDQHPAAIGGEGYRSDIRQQLGAADHLPRGHLPDPKLTLTGGGEPPALRVPNEPKEWSRLASHRGLLLPGRRVPHFHRAILEGHRELLPRRMERHGSGRMVRVANAKQPSPVGRNPRP